MKHFYITWIQDGIKHISMWNAKNAKVAQSQFTRDHPRASIMKIEDAV